MSVDVQPFQVEDLELLDYREKFAEIERIPRATLRAAYEGPYSYTAWHVSGVPLMAGGVVTEKGEAWVLGAKHVGLYQYRLLRIVRDYVLIPYTRDNGPPFAQVDTQDPLGIRWVRLLGFRQTETGLWVYDAHLQ